MPRPRERVCLQDGLKLDLNRLALKGWCWCRRAPLRSCSQLLCIAEAQLPDRSGQNEGYPHFLDLHVLGCDMGRERVRNGV